jgi:hypothetical protein
MLGYKTLFRSRSGHFRLEGHTRDGLMLAITYKRGNFIKTKFLGVICR